MLLYNTLQRHKEEFTPIRQNEVHLYVCGITAYDYCHIGHARSALVFDVLVRHLRHLGYKVVFVRNFTDVDDKIIRRANLEQRDWQEIAQTYIDAFHEDMDALGVLRADLEPRATEHIDEIQQLCQQLISVGNAYPTKSGDVYFRVRSYAPYGKLSGRSLDEMLAGARVLPGEEKEDPLDFAIWKAAKPDEPAWSSTWGKGRPGWHIECSAMSRPYVPLDIHGGGQDLIFPHHENEIAQSEVVCGCELANIWMHNGFVRINAEKMSKSLNNFKTIRDLLQSYLPETLRFFLLDKHYRSPVDFSSQGMEEAEKAQHRIYMTLQEVQKALQRTNWKKIPLPAEIWTEWSELKHNFVLALDDDLNTAQAIGQIFSQIRLVNRLLEDKKLRNSEESKKLFEDLLLCVHNWQEELGLFGEQATLFLERLRKMRAVRANLDLSRVQSLLASRYEARTVQKDFALSDALRAELATLGVVVRDTPDGQEWDLA